jgi:hypothetical protein
MEASGEFTVTSWQEDAYDEPAEGGKLTRAQIGQDWTGDLAGTATITSLMAYAPDGGTARFVGLQRMSGTLGGREGTFVLESSGDFDGEVARASLRVLPGSGTGGLAGLTGEGSYEAPLGPSGTYRLTYDLG